MNFRTSLVVDFLGAQTGISPAQLNRLNSWWHVACQPDEELLDFLQRQRLLREPTARVLAHVAAAQLSPLTASALLDRTEFEALRDRLSEIECVREQDLAATVTLVPGADTVKEWSVLQSSAPATEPQVGSRLGKYLLTELIGQGASGVVYRALHPSLRIPVAVKVLRHPANGGRDEPHGQPHTEACLLATLSHPHVVRVFDYEPDAPHPYIVLEYVNGPSLAELISHCGRLQPSRVVRMARQLAEALGAAHRAGVVHRDLKPANVLLTRDGDVKLADLGLATMPGSAPAGQVPPADARAGTVLYMAPERIGTPRPADPRSDVYSLGATLFHALTGRPPFQGGTAWQVLSQHLRTPPPAPVTLVPELPPELSNLILTMLAKDPADRPSSAALLREPVLSQEWPEAVCQPRQQPGVRDRRSETAAPPVWRRMLHRFRSSMLKAEAILV
jgi:serine/threonine protein kinase